MPYEDVEAGRWQPLVAPEYSRQYVRQLQSQAKKTHTIWPYHVLLGGPGNAHSSTMEMVRALVAAMREGRPHPNDVEDNWVSFATAMAALESVRTGQAVKVAAE